eukprot:4566424-Prymnesium_polylepis.1
MLLVEPADGTQRDVAEGGGDVRREQPPRQQREHVGRAHRVVEGRVLDDVGRLDIAVRVLELLGVPAQLARPRLLAEGGRLVRPPRPADADRLALADDVERVVGFGDDARAPALHLEALTRRLLGRHLDRDLRLELQHLREPRRRPRALDIAAARARCAAAVRHAAERLEAGADGLARDRGVLA